MSYSTRTIKVSSENYEKLAQLGTLEDSFDTVIGRLLGSYYYQKQQQLQKRALERAQERPKTER